MVGSHTFQEVPTMTRVAEIPNQVKRIWRHSFQSELDSALEQQMRAQALAGVQTVLESALTAEVEADRHTATDPALRGAYRSGYFTRRVLTSFGAIPTVHVPKLRTGNRARAWRILQRYQQTMPAVLDKLCYLYTMGLSLRDLEEGLYVLFGHVLSRGAINRVTLAAQSPMDAWHTQRLTDTPPVVIIDGVWVSIQYPTGETWIDRSGHERHRVHAQERVILAVLGVWPDGRHQLIHYSIATAEDAASWQAVWRTLCARGLDAAQVQVVVSDGAKGVLAAVQQELPQARLQRCTVHKVRGFAQYLRYTDLPTVDADGNPLSRETARHHRQQAMKTAALAIFDAPTRIEAEGRLQTFIATWQPLEPAAVRNFTFGIKRCFTFYQLDAPLHRLVRSTNLLERFFREVRAKTDEIGAFPNDESCLVLFHLVMLREHAKHDRLDSAKT
jgi:putative transposase